MSKVVCRWATFGDIRGDIGDIQGLGDIGDIGDIALATFPSGDIGDIGLATLATLRGDIRLWLGFGLAWALAGWVARPSGRGDIHEIGDIGRHSWRHWRHWATFVATLATLATLGSLGDIEATYNLGWHGDACRHGEEDQVEE